MPVVKIASATLIGIEAREVEIEIDAKKNDSPFIAIVGLPDPSIKESKQRILPAIHHSGFSIGAIEATINLAPANLKKEGTVYDFPIALGLLESLGILPKNVLKECFLAGELGLSGELRPILGALSMALLAKKNKKKSILLPFANGSEAAKVPGIKVFGIKNLQEAVRLLLDQNSLSAFPYEPTFYDNRSHQYDFADIKGQSNVKRALEIAAAGGHNVLLVGPPGSGKTLAARAFATILPPMDLDEILDVTKIYSVAGLLDQGQSVVTARPFRNPHHTVSYAGMIGGGSHPRPGEVTLAHHGVLFLDELTEFSRHTLEALRQPLEDKKVTIARAKHHMTFPSQFSLIAAMNPCPCGYLGHPTIVCKDSELQIEHYKKKISGPLLDRIDLHISVSPVRFQDLNLCQKEEPSSLIAQRVLAARDKQKKRFCQNMTNSQMNSREVSEKITLNLVCQNLLQQAIDQMGLSARAYHRVLKVARTIADLSNEETVEEDHIMEALSYRQF